MLNNRNVLLCVSGGIAVYKACALTSKLVQAGANVKVIMTESACRFVSPLTFQALSRHEVYTDTFKEQNPSVISHIDAADWADLVIVAPATANVIGKLANGIADDMLTTTLLAATAPVWIAPAMNVHMYDHPAVKRNISVLYQDGFRFIEPSEGYLACGYVGKGRLEEPENIVKLAEKHFADEKIAPLEGKRVVITAGPTREAVDPVRFFTNKSTGKMGYALAEAAVQLGAQVTLISGPVSLELPKGLSQFIPVQSAADMREAVLSVYDASDIVIKTAAVADFTPKTVFDHKMKKQDGGMTLELKRTVDILKELGEKKQEQLLVGFAAETQDVEHYARKKLAAKNLDMIVANDVKANGAGFGADTNIVTIFFKDGRKRELPMMSKLDVSFEILQEIAALLTQTGERP
ncbi:bifunctional phosphopantothenoylcysteine decarboxylase/phosphopantothenate--cysteine ligase CoaBC [Bacillus inaquosorum]|uniref:bifunctional phosphopantothenoylcysteine decarboxylase/phosphopantothenate--cysteine ligase CoaBC n=1 Tax=Bacillus inaquosorum TaxID=483913 RepID=UPI00227EE3CE|nr:bifunctional phosphopantothenoylcysteine decarboxylase/phosphopantothenate--cysteine ligase CoaBC [Bacillus inaquosorum]MCY8721878.1 bifunctional phosphopantothenoylcysteine decarboxylase/phosphopantothenate--cysteine ligase CoaBC [Bacillus inaquosorum]MCY9032446.1 bifunctional phosphopantothenoylcysteine decarboxylase/phosphopantothenate--cysteine ligase CoaBC [Bacillus inaquosorum]MEC0638230.1 bifunctional phosphopantothenoylcysteine decarboxylase/phosphopantothenate--cysteine ligase CoaBC 